ncbi:response regulator [Vibrio sp. SM6]|uniref:histidine kinase n=1 Tax=Vibrio agarilyticus TaxID=2726741 RepID=A0A7X8YGP0_9VIBR|nr:response regulator [Vibrio agarilyticus]NLS12745.1 response regulator [Vibrio agarilyticus]
MFSFYRKRKFKRLQSTLMAAFLALSLTPLTVIALFFLQAHTADLQEQSTSHLRSMLETKQRQLQNYYLAQEAQVMGFVRSELAYNSGGRFYGLVNAFKSLGHTIAEARVNAQQRYIKGSGDLIKTTMRPESSAYVGSERYRLLHERYHWAFLELLKRSDFDDILLVDIEGNVTYSIYKHENFGTNLLNAPQQATLLGRTFRALSENVHKMRKQNEDYTPVYLSDFTTENGKSYAWLGAPIIKQGYLHSFAMFRLPSNGISKLIADSEQNTSIQTLLVGDDRKPRSLASEQSIINNSAPIINRAFDGQKDVGNYTNGIGETLIAGFAPITLGNLSWALVVQLPEAEAFARIHQLEKVFIIAMVTAIVLVVIASHYLSNFITAPLLRLTWAAEKVSAGDLEETVINTERKDEIGRLAISFERMQRSIREKIQLIKTQNQELESNLLLIKKQNRELQLADKLKDEFLATTSHELRTPLHGMVGIAETLMSGANGPIPTNQKYQLDIIVKSGHRLANLVDDLLDYHKMRFGSLDINHSAVDLASSTRLVLELSNHLVDKKPLRIINQVPSDLPLVSADPQRLEQVLYNLVGNAIKYTSEGKVVISASVSDEQVRIQVVDTGQGIPADLLEYIFEPLTQIGDANGRFRQGTGLGLSVSRQLIELMGGNLYVSSQPLVGTTFSFNLPLATEAQIADRDNSIQNHHFQLPDDFDINALDETSLPENPQGQLVLVADDEPVNLRILESFLRIEGYRVQTAQNGHDTLEKIAQEPPALLLLDIMMPGMSGYEVCKTLRQHHDSDTLPVIMLTALNQAEDRQRGFESGANDYLSKPFNKQELIARVQAHLSASQANAQLQQNERLHQELKQRSQIEADLLETQQRLLEQLDSAPEAVVCLRENGRIHYANRAAAKLFKRSIDQLKRSQGDEIIAPKYLAQSQSHYCGEIDIYVADVRQHIECDILRLPQGVEIDSMFIFNVGGGANVARIHQLETALDVLARYAFDGDKEQLQTLKELGGEFTRLADKALGDAKSKQDLMRELLVDVMSNALDYWESATGESKFSFAEKSGLWRVYLDRSTLQTRTLDKYMRIETLPKTPRWRTVISSIEFILEHCKEPTPQRQHIEALKDKLQHLLSN